MLKLLIITLVISVVFSSPSPKIDSALENVLREKGSANIILTLREGTSTVLSKLGRTKFASRTERLNSVAAALKQHAAVTQKSLLEFLSSRPLVKTQSFWISNQILVQNADLSLVQTLASMQQIADIKEEIIIKLQAPSGVPYSSETGNTPRAEWGVEKIESEQAWEIPNGGNNGTNVIVANIDTGVHYTHQLLRSNYLGDYGWFDPYEATSTPNDQNGLGTHIMGTIAGQGGIGVAPGAKWMACKGCSAFACLQSAILTCGQFIACPTSPNGQNADCSKAPHVVANSWGGGQGQTWYNAVVTAWHAAGVTPIFSQGSAGSNCASAGSPGDQPIVIAVGSTTAVDSLSPFSGLGPSIEGVIKPDISAPGQSITSAYATSDTALFTLSGTSMAAAHVAGVAVLLKGYDETLSYTEIKEYLFSGAETRLQETGNNCGGINENTFPNNAFGHGRVNAFNSLSNLINSRRN